MRKILFVDDENQIGQIFKKTFSKDFAIKTTTNPDEAIEYLLHEKFHVIVSDQRMPQKTGIELLKESLGIQPECQRILVTAYTDYDVLVEAINNCQLFQFINKPWDRESFKLTLLNATEKSHTALKNKLLIDKMIALNKELDEKNQELEKLLVHKDNQPSIENTIKDINQNLSKQKYIRQAGNQPALDEQELIILSFQINKKNDLLRHIRQQLAGLVVQHNYQKRIQNLINSIDSEVSQDDMWSQMQFVLKKIKPIFYSNLIKAHPTLTEYELKLASLINEKVSTKDISFILNISYESANTSKYRLRKKLGLKKDIRLSEYLDNFNNTVY